MAGDSADEVARRAREKAEKLLRNAEMWEKGAAGERAVQELLAQLPAEWTVFHDVHWPGRSRANIDHLVVGPGGVFVIDAKNWSGSMQVRDGVLRQNGYRRDSAIESAKAAAAAVASLAPSLPSSAVVPVLCFTGDAATDGALGGVVLCSADQLLQYLLRRPATMSQEWLDYLRFELDMSTRAATGPPAAPITLPPPPARSVAAAVRPAKPSKRVRSRSPRSKARTFKRFVFGFGFFVISVMIFALPWPAARNNPAVGEPLSIVLLIAAFLASRRYIQ